MSDTDDDLLCGRPWRTPQAIEAQKAEGRRIERERRHPCGMAHTFSGIVLRWTDVTPTKSGLYLYREKRGIWMTEVLWFRLEEGSPWELSAAKVLPSGCVDLFSDIDKFRGFWCKIGSLPKGQPARITSYP